MISVEASNHSMSSTQASRLEESFRPTASLSLISILISVNLLLVLGLIIIG